MVVISPGLPQVYKRSRKIYKRGSLFAEGAISCKRTIGNWLIRNDFKGSEKGSIIRRPL